MVVMPSMSVVDGSVVMVIIGSSSGSGSAAIDRRIDIATRDNRQTSRLHASFQYPELLVRLSHSTKNSYPLQKPAATRAVERAGGQWTSSRRCTVVRGCRLRFACVLRVCVVVSFLFPRQAGAAGRGLDGRARVNPVLVGEACKGRQKSLAIAHRHTPPRHHHHYECGSLHR